MLNTFLLFLFLGVSYGYDHDLYKNCSRVDVCSQNRALARQERFKALIEGSVFAQGVASIRVQDVVGTGEYALVISAIEGGAFRVQFEEADSARYHVEHMLNGDPEVINFDDIDLTLTSISLLAGESTVTVTTAPFSVNFYVGGNLQLVLEGDRITLQNLETSTPFTFGVSFPAAQRLYGLHEHADNLALRTTSPDGTDPYRVRTLDLTYYELYDTQAMYGAIPVLYGHGLGGTAGVFLNNAAEEWVEITNDATAPSAFFMVDSGALDLFVLPGPTPGSTLKQYMKLTGTPHLPPIWALGYHQCRWGYWNQTDLLTTVEQLTNASFPLDAIWLDIQHTDADKFFTWNPENFSTPLEMQASLAEAHKVLITLTDPHFKKEDGYWIYDTGLANDYFIKNPNGSVYEAECWPGTSVWMDYLNPDVREYYAGLYQYDSWNGTTATLAGIWNDMNEAAVFNTDDEKTFPYDLVHYGGVRNRDLHNTYGLLQVMSTHAGLLARDENARRPFILSRAHTAGTQRYSAIWTGDNTAEWGFINISYAMCLSSALCGVSFCGADIGGFWDEPSEELLQRFYQSGAWLPFFREHSGQDSARREPYLYSDEVQDNIRATMRRRYDHIPFWYTKFYEHVRGGEPIIRPMWYEFPEDPEVLDIDDQLFVGSEILVKAISDPNVTTVPVYFPGGADLEWFEADLHPRDEIMTGVGWVDVPVTIEKIPTYYKEGAIIPVKPMERLSTAEMKDDWYMLYILLDDQNFTATGNVYMDDEISFEYQTSSTYSYLNIFSDYKNLGYDVTLTPIDVSNGDDFELLLGVLVFMVPDGADGYRRGRYSQRTFDRTADGTLLRDIKISSHKKTILKF